MVHDVGRQPHGHWRALPGGVRLQAVENRRQVRFTVERAHAEQSLRLFVVRRQIVRGDRPSQTGVRRLGKKLARAEPKEGSAIPFGLAAHIEVLFRDD